MADPGMEALLQMLYATLDATPGVREQGEAGLAAAASAPGFGLALAHVATAADLPYGVKQLAAVVLKQYVKEHWQEGEERYKPPTCADAEKAAIRQLLPRGLADPMGKIRTAVGMAVAAIARLDWPEAWPELTGTLIGAIRERASPEAVHGALRCLALIAGDVDEASLPRVVPLLFPELYTLVTATLDGAPGCTPSLARRALAVLHACLGTLQYMGRAAAGAARELVVPYTPMWLDVCGRVLSAPLQPGSAAACGLQMEALKVLMRLLVAFPPAAGAPGADAARALASVWSLLSRAHPAYMSAVVNEAGGAGDDDGQECDSDGEELSLEALVAQLLELLLCLVGQKRNHAAVTAAVPSLVPLALELMQLTAEQARDWDADAAAFTVEEEEDLASVRATGEILLDDLLAELPGPTAPALAAALGAALSPGASWKAREAALLALGACAERLLEPGAPSGAGAPDIGGIITQLVTVGELSPLGARGAPPLLAARALRTCARLARAVPPGAASPLLDAVIAALQPSSHGACRAAAARAAGAFVPHAKPAALTPRLHALHSALGITLAQAVAQPDSGAAEMLLDPVIDALRALVRADANAAAAAAPTLAPHLLAAWSAHHNDPLLAPAAASVLGALARSPSAAASLHAAVLPQLRAVLLSPAAQPPGLPAAALELAHALLRRHGGDEAVARQAHAQLFAPAAALAASADDASLVALAVALLRDLLRGGGGAAVAWGVDGCGGGADAVSVCLDVAARLLAPGQRDDAAAASAAPLLCSLLRRAPAACAPLVPAIAAAAASRLRAAAAGSAHHTLAPTLVRFFARLVHALGPDAFTELLAAQTDAAVCGDDGAALVTVMRAWTLAQPDVVGAGAIRATTSALVALLCCGHPALSAVTVRGEPLPDDAAPAIRTRSRAKAAGPPRYAAAPLPAALLALVADALLEQAEAEEGGGFDDWGGSNDTDDDDDDGGDDGGCAEDDAVERAAQQGALEALAAGTLSSFAFDAADDDGEEELAVESDEDEAAAATPLAPWVGAQLRAALAAGRAPALAAAAAGLSAKRQQALQACMAAPASA